MNIIKKMMLISSLISVPVIAAEPFDQFSRAKCYNNESITYNYFDPPQWRGVTSWHFVNGYRQHYVTEDPADPTTCYFSAGGYHQVNGLYCYHYITLKTRHAGVHGGIFPSEPSPEDGWISPFDPNDWRTEGVHTLVWPGIGYTVAHTSATDCNLHLDQFY